MNYFDILLQMKTGQKVPYSKDYFDTLFAAKLADLQIKTLTGTLPLTFRTSETALRSWTIYGNNYEHTYSADQTLPLTFSTNTAGAASDWEIRGNDNVGKNLLQITTETVTRNSVQFAADRTSGMITATRIELNANASNYTSRISFTADTKVLMSGCPANGSNESYIMYAWDYTTNVRCKKWDNTTPSDNDFGEGGVEIFFPANHDTAVICRIVSGYDAQNVVFKPMLRLADTSADFEPYQVGVGQRTENGYIIPLSVNGDTVNLPIGNAPLTAGQSISKTSTGVDITAVQGANTITTELYNKPEMSIEGVDYVGVGAKSGDEYIIRVQNSATIAPYKPNAPESDTSYVYNSTTQTLDTNSRYKTALINWQGGSGNYTITKNKGSTFTLEALQYLGNWGGADHYVRLGTITPTGTTYTDSTSGSHLLITYYDSEVDTLTPEEIRESITVTATVSSTRVFDNLDAPLTEGQTLTSESTGKDITTFAGVENTIEPFNPEIYDYGEFDMSITYKGG